MNGKVESRSLLTSLNKRSSSSLVKRMVSWIWIERLFCRVKMDSMMSCLFQFIPAFWRIITHFLLYSKIRLVDKQRDISLNVIVDFNSCKDLFHRWLLIWCNNFPQVYEILYHPQRMGLSLQNRKCLLISSYYWNWQLMKILMHHDLNLVCIPFLLAGFWQNALLFCSFLGNGHSVWFLRIILCTDLFVELTTI